MALDFNPKSESQLAEMNLAPEGEYDFEVLEARDEVSKKGNAMIAVKIGVYEGDRVRWHVYDYLLAAMEAKLRHFCDTVGLLQRYESGSLSAQDCVGRGGKCRIKVKPAEGGYGPKNVVNDYVVRAAKALASAPATPKAPEQPEDDVPF